MKWTHWFFGDSIDKLDSVHWEFHSPFPVGLLLALSLLAVVSIVALYRKQIKFVNSRRGWIAASLRISAVLLLLFLLADPCVVGRYVTPSRQIVILLFDDSQSMQVHGAGNQPRGRHLLEAYRAAQPAFETYLKDRFQLVRYSFGRSISSIQDIGRLTFQQPRSDLAGALRQAMSEWNNTEIAAIILFSDGAQNPVASLDTLAPSNRRQVPIYTVGVDRDSGWRDLRVRNITVKENRVENNPMTLTAEIDSTGFSQQTVRVELLENRTVVQSKSIPVDSSQPLATIQFQHRPQTRDWVELSVRVQSETAGVPALLPDAPSSRPVDRVPQNNQRTVLIDNNPKKVRILYVSGRPNWQHKFIRRAVQDDPQILITSLIRISAAQTKFEYRGQRSIITNPLFEGFDQDQEKFGRYDEPVYLRIGASESELTNGFPSLAEELFQYHMIVFGDAERSLFTLDQLKLVKEFVSKRGGSLLLLGGPRSLAEGGYKDSPLESILPVLLPFDTRSDPMDHRRRFELVPSFEGEYSGIWMLHPDSDENRRLWHELPYLFGFNPLDVVRAGATVWAYAFDEDLDRRQPVFVTQRYGHGQCAVFATGETWPWEMDTEPDSPYHAKIWRQILHGMTNQILEPIALREKQDRYVMDETLQLQWLVRDNEYNESEGQLLRVQVLSPGGQAVAVPVDESIRENGVYTTEWIPQEPGAYTWTVERVDREGTVLASKREAVLVARDESEFNDPRYQPALLQDLAARTGGKFYELHNFTDVLNQLAWTPVEEARIERIHLWHVPFFYALLVLLLSAEWYIRRKKGMP